MSRRTKLRRTLRRASSVQNDTGHSEANEILVINREMAGNLLYFVDKKSSAFLKIYFSVLITWMCVPASESVHICLYGASGWSPHCPPISVSLPTLPMQRT